MKKETKSLLQTVILLIFLGGGLLFLYTKINMIENEKLSKAETQIKTSTPAPSPATANLPVAETSKKTDSASTISPRDFEKLVVQNGKPLIIAASVENSKGKAITRSDSEFLGVWVSREWDFLTDIDKRTFIKLHLSVFNQWRGKDDGIVMILDNSGTELASGNKYSISLKK